MGASGVVTAAAARVEGSHERLLDALVATVRTQFATEVIHVDPDDPVFGRGRCTVAGCERTAWTRQICTATAAGGTGASQTSSSSRHHGSDHELTRLHTWSTPSACPH
ncbi:MAG TPA: hypothetical protein VGW38_04930 [Chloroflexota bacterium]|nr:hypothetical protein [Chloroflexota bacterium]